MKIGAHVSTAGGVSKAVERGVEIGCEALQIFGSSPQSWAFRDIPDAEIEAFQAGQERRRDRGGLAPCHVPW